MNYVQHRLLYGHSKTADHWRMLSKFGGWLVGAGVTLAFAILLGAILAGWFTGAMRIEDLKELMK